MPLYKLLKDDGTPGNGGVGTWSLPKGKRPGKWMPSITPVIACKAGYHLCRARDILTWSLPTLWVAEGRGEMVEEEDKVVFSEARLLRKVELWNPRIQQELACDFAEHTLHLFESRFPTDDRPRRAIEVARRFARGEVAVEELEAAREAAWLAARSATRLVARSAAGAARSAARSAAGAAWSAAEAARSAAWSAAWEAEQEWQVQHLIEVLGLDPD